MLVFVDETGDHDLIKIDPQYPIFALGALLISEEEYVKMDKAMQKLKVEYFHDDGTFILHSSELKRPNGERSDPRNLVMFDSVFRSNFYTAFEREIIAHCQFSIAACFIRKAELKHAYFYPADPYYFSFENLLNRVLRYGGSKNTIYAEKRGPQLDTELIAEYERLSKVGIHFYTGTEVTERSSLTLINKKENMNGLQAIDLILASLARSYLGKEYKMTGNDIRPSLLRKKFTCTPTYFPNRKLQQQ